MKKLILITLILLSFVGCQKEKVEVQPEPQVKSLEIGDTYAGGIVFYLAVPDVDLNGDGIPDRGLVVSPEVLGEYSWGCPFEDLDDSMMPNHDSGSQGPGTRIGDGADNTKAILALCADLDSLKINFAAEACDDYEYIDEDGVKYDDWFLPSRDEMWYVVYNLKDWTRKSIWWTSTEMEKQYAWTIEPTAWMMVIYSSSSKKTKYNVLAVRAF